VTASARLPEFPDLPTFKDLGYDELTAVTWFALSGPAGLPNDITQRLNAAVAKMLELPDVRKRLDRDAVETRVMTSDEFTTFMASEIDRWTPVARRVMPGIEPTALATGRHSDPATPACCRTLAQRTVSDLTKRSSSSGEPFRAE
jgi:Uncharacterized protein conserved in bacteria